MKLKCNCKHAYQDSVYGDSVRVHTPKSKVEGRPPEYSCTVCSTTRTASGVVTKLRKDSK